MEREAADAALSEIDRESQRAAAAALARRLLREPAGRPEQQRVAAALVRRGFGFEIARLAVADALGEAAADLD